MPNPLSTLYDWLIEPILKLYARDLRVQVKQVTGERDLAVANLSNAQSQNASLQTSVNAKDEKISVLEQEVKKYLTAGRRLYREVVDLRPLRLRVPELEGQLVEERKLIELLTEKLGGRDEKLADLLREVEARQKELDRTSSRMRRVQRQQNYLTQAKALQNVPKFRPLAERGRAIVSVLNLKGGVGKTTITANLAAALARKGYRVLMVDLDLQGSLSALMMSAGDIQTLNKNGSMTQDFFRAASENVLLKLSPYAVPVPGGPPDLPGSMYIVPATDQLAYSELSLTLSWLLKQGERDARFLLRKALHFITDNKPYDIVLLDCPPLLNISCVNALAASDYLLMPTLLSAKAIERLPVLMEVVEQENFKKYVNSQLRVLGVVANRTNRTPPAGNEAFLWQTLPSRMSDSYSTKVKLFDAVIGQDAKITAGEAQFAHPEPGSRARAMFDALAAEVEKELPNECRIASPPPAGPG